MKSRNFFAELKRRNVYKVAITYTVVAWLLIQAASILLPTFEAPSWVMKAFVVFLAFGFVISVMISWAFEATPEGLKRTEDVPADVAATLPTWSRRKFATFVIVVALLAAGLLAFNLFRSNPLARSTTAAASSIPQKSIAVLPFENLSDDKSNAYFASGIQEELLTRLSKIADLKVISRTSTEKFKTAPQNLREVAQQVGVATVLEGSVQRVADQVRVTVQLMNARSDSHLWAETYDRKLTDIFAVETEIANAIAKTLQAKLTGSERQAIAVRPTENREAHELYLKGRYLAAKRNTDDLKRSIDYFIQATEKDPNYAVAFAGLAESYALLPQYSIVDPKEFFAKARAAAEKALELDDTVAEAHTSLGFILADNELRFKEGQREFETAIALDPNSANAHYFLGLCVFNRLGQGDAAIAELKRALQLDPLSSIINSNLALCYIDARRYGEAIAQLRKMVELDPNFFYARGMLGVALMLNGDVPAGIAELEKANETRASFQPLVFLAYAYAKMGSRDRMQYYIDQATEFEKRAGRPWFYGRAIISLARDDKQAAIEYLEKSYEAKETGVISAIKVDPWLDPLRGDPRFEALAKKIVPASQFGPASK